MTLTISQIIQDRISAILSHSRLYKKALGRSWLMFFCVSKGTQSVCRGPVVCGVFKLYLKYAIWSIHLTQLGIIKSRLFHLHLLSWVRIWGQEYQQRSPDFPLPSHRCQVSKKSERAHQQAPLSTASTYSEALWKRYQIIKKECFQVVFINLNKCKTTIMTQPLLGIPMGSNILLIHKVPLAKIQTIYPHIIAFLRQQQHAADNSVAWLM